MKQSTFALLMMVTALVSSNVWAKGRSFDSRPPYTLETVHWVGSFRCEEKLHEAGHESDHDCDLRFVKEETGEVWNIRDNPTLSALHKKYGGAVRVRIVAASSPRFLLGGSFVDVKQIEVLGKTSCTSRGSE